MMAESSGGIGEIASWDYIADAADGSYYMGMVQRFMLGNSEGIMMSPPVTDNPDGNAKLRFFYQNKVRSGGRVVLEVYCKKETSKEWIPLLVLDAITNTWTKQEVDLPVSAERLQVIFLAKTEGACGAFVDDVSILKPRKGDALEVASKPVGCQIGVREGCCPSRLSCPSMLGMVVGYCPVVTKQGSRRSVCRPASMWCESGNTFGRFGFPDMISWPWHRFLLAGRRRRTAV